MDEIRKFDFEKLVDEKIKSNGKGEITAEVLNDVLKKVNNVIIIDDNNQEGRKYDKDSRIILKENINDAYDATDEISGIKTLLNIGYGGQVSVMDEMSIGDIMVTLDGVTIVDGFFVDVGIQCSIIKIFGFLARKKNDDGLIISALSAFFVYFDKNDKTIKTMLIEY